MAMQCDEDGTEAKVNSSNEQLEIHIKNAKFLNEIVKTDEKR